MLKRSPLISGVIAAAAAIAASEALAAAFNLRESPVLAVGQTVIRLTPGPMAEAIIGVVGTKDKTLAVTSVVIAIVLLGALVGRWWATRRIWALALVGVLVAAAAASVQSRAYGTAAGVLVCFVAGAVVIGVLELLQRTTDAGPDESRRMFLRNAGFVVAGTAVAGGLGEMLASRHRRRQALERVRAALKLPSRKVPVPAGADLGIKEQGAWLTPTKQFYRIDTALSPPLIDPAEWSLRIHGMVDKELTLTYQDLLDRGLHDSFITICCVSNEVGGELIGNTVWGGVPMKGILDEVGIQAGADALLSTSDDGWTCGTPLAALTDGRDAMLALTMNGEPLPIAHGFPVRQVVPGLYGYVSATKWVTEWKITKFDDFEAYWTQRGWGVMGPIKTESRIDVPQDGSSVDAGPVTIAGVAWRQHVGIKAVEVRFDEGEWQQAQLATVPSVDTWVQWTLEWPAKQGDHIIEVRATDGEGTPQTSEIADVLPDGATGYHRIAVRVE